MADVTIIGAGVAGLWAAYALSQRAITPRLIDRAGAPGAHGCSWWAGGMLAPFCEGATSEPAVIAHGQQAASDWAKVTDVARHGSLVVTLARDRAELDRFARRTSGHSRIGGAALADLEPDLALPGREALFFGTEAHLTPRRALADLVAALAAKGITIEQAEASPDDIPGTVIDCRGLAAKLPGLRGVRGEMVMLRSPEVALSRPVRLLHPRHPLYIVPRGDGVFMLGATQIETAAPGPVTARALLELLSAAYALHPAFAEAQVIETGADLRPAFADHVPRVIRQGRVLHLNGLFRHGYLMAPALARQAADYLETGTKGDLFHED
ncbi:MAG: FAD-dependent oxidoreductase [Rhodobacterales bacterium]|nr:FAD-dependent oxidoreductase [Rhodobacterales bacterium]MDX5390405.1 FAD-dependent oxidoreductase [Rhodobacterales bacterium]MDX5490093.1 FAD-dependent oxidoreductase [Rhodobacterales bacterium]